MNNRNTMALKALISAGKEYAPELSEDVLKTIYEIQVRNQFEKDRDIPLKEMSQVIENRLRETENKS